MRSLALAFALVALSLGLAGATGAEPRWVEVGELEVRGRGWTKDTASFGRLPSRFAERLPGQAWAAARSSAGLFVDFTTDSPDLTLTWVSHSIESRVALGPLAFDLYLRTDEQWRHALSLPPSNDAVGPQSAQVFTGLAANDRTFRLYFPLGCRVSKVRLGIDAASTLEALPSPKAGDTHPIVLFGGPDAAGAGASRAGSCLPALLGRRLGREVIDLGLPAEDLLTLEFGALLAELNASVFVFDLMRDVSAENLAVELEPFINGLRTARPWASVLVVDAPDPPAALLDPALAIEYAERRENQARVVNELGASGVAGVYHLRAEGLVGNDQEWSIDGHLRGDDAFEHTVEILTRSLRPILSAWTGRGE